MSNENMVNSSPTIKVTQELTAFHVTGIVIVVSRVAEMNEEHGTGSLYYRVTENLWMTENSSLIGTGGSLARVVDKRMIEILEKSFTQQYCSAIIEKDGSVTWQ